MLGEPCDGRTRAAPSPHAPSARCPIAKLSIEQRRLTHRGREFHFVLYEGTPANPKRDLPAVAPTWYLMSGGSRWEVMLGKSGRSEDALETLLTAWLDEHVFASRSGDAERAS